MTQGISEKYREGFANFFSILFVFYLLFAFAVCSGIFIVTPVSDRQNKLRYLYNFLGLSPAAYYLGNFLADVLIFTLASAGFVLLFFPLRLIFLTPVWPQVFALIASFGVQLVGCTYFVSFIFKDSNYAFNKIGMWYMILGLSLPMLFSIYLLVGTFHPDSDNPYRKWVYIMLIDPFWGLFQGLLRITFT